jgi:cellulose 1,4-beta-cellobiosidase
VINWSASAPASGSSPPDTSPPSAPSALNYADASATSITLIWRAATDNVAVTGYQVFRGSTLIGTTTDITYTDDNLTPSTAYGYTVKALDAAGNVSSASNTLNVSTTQDFSADSDHDGIPDATETAMGTNPNSAATLDTTNQTQQNIHRPTK